jgi:hypothetical protein
MHTYNSATNQHMPRATSIGRRSNSLPMDLVAGSFLRGMHHLLHLIYLAVCCYSRTACTVILLPYRAYVSF